MTKLRADILIHNRGLAESREKAKIIIMEGRAFTKSGRIEKAGELIDEDEEIKVKGKDLEFVSRGGYKLKKILEDYKLSLEGKICMDIGASTGGFTDCMLKYGAKKIYAVDVGYNQLDYRIRKDSRVVVLERQNIRYLDDNLIEDEINFISIDVSFISLELVLPKAVTFGGDNLQIVALIKPQFEAGKEKVGKGGIVKDTKVHVEVLEKILNLAGSLNLFVKDITYSPIKGTKGNIEFLIYMDTNLNISKDFDLKKIALEAKDNLKK